MHPQDWSGRVLAASSVTTTAHSAESHAEASLPVQAGSPHVLLPLLTMLLLLAPSVMLRKGYPGAGHLPQHHMRPSFLFCCDWSRCSNARGHHQSAVGTCSPAYEHATPIVSGLTINNATKVTMETLHNDRSKVPMLRKNLYPSICSPYSGAFITAHQLSAHAT